jgi:hypothetical protein
VFSFVAFLSFVCFEFGRILKRIKQYVNNFENVNFSINWSTMYHIFVY